MAAGKQKQKPVYLSVDGKEHIKIYADADEIQRLFDALKGHDGLAGNEDVIRSFFAGARTNVSGDGSVSSKASASPSVVSKGNTTLSSRGSLWRRISTNSNNSLRATADVARVPSRVNVVENPIAEGVEAEIVGTGVRVDGQSMKSSKSTVSMGGQCGQSVMSVSSKAKSSKSTSSMGGQSVTSTPSKAKSSSTGSMSKSDASSSHADQGKIHEADGGPDASTSPFVENAASMKMVATSTFKALRSSVGSFLAGSGANDDKSADTCMEPSIEVVKRKGKTSIGFYGRNKKRNVRAKVLKRMVRSTPSPAEESQVGEEMTIDKFQKEEGEVAEEVEKVEKQADAATEVAATPIARAKVVKRMVRSTPSPAEKSQVGEEMTIDMFQKEEVEEVEKEAEATKEVVAAPVEAHRSKARGNAAPPASSQADEQSGNMEPNIEVVRRRGKTVIGLFQKQKIKKSEMVEPGFEAVNWATKPSGRKVAVGIYKDLDPREEEGQAKESSEKSERSVTKEEGEKKSMTESENDSVYEYEGIEAVKRKGRTVIGISLESTRRGELSEDDGRDAGNLSLIVDGEEVQTVSLGSQALELLVSCANPCVCGPEEVLEEDLGSREDVTESSVGVSDIFEDDSSRGKVLQKARDDALNNPSSSKVTDEAKQQAIAAARAAVGDASSTASNADQPETASDRSVKSIKSTKSNKSNTSRRSSKSVRFEGSEPKEESGHVEITKEVHQKWIDPLRNKTSMFDDLISEVEDEREDSLERENPAVDDREGREDEIRNDVDKEIPLVRQVTQWKAAIDQDGNKHCFYDASKEAKKTKSTQIVGISSKAARKKLDKYWRATIDAKTGREYYYNKKTKESTWDKPLMV